MHYRCLVGFSTAKSAATSSAAKLRMKPRRLRKGTSPKQQTKETPRRVGNPQKNQQITKQIQSKLFRISDVQLPPKQVKKIHSKPTKSPAKPPPPKPRAVKTKGTQQSQLPRQLGARGSDRSIRCTGAFDQPSCLCPSYGGRKQGENMVKARSPGGDSWCLLSVGWKPGRFDLLCLLGYVYFFWFNCDGYSHSSVFIFYFFF